MKSDLALTICPQCGFEIKYASSEKWRGTIKCRDCGVRFRVDKHEARASPLKSPS